jgi:gamma-F420-2:alpha-L-glutamate ligase
MRAGGSITRGWLFFHSMPGDSAPEQHEINRFVESGKRRGITLDVLQPRDFELIVTTDRDWRAEYAGGKLPRPDFIVPRTGAETSYFTLAVLRQFERMGVMMINGAEAVEACADKLQTLQLLSASGLPIPRTILAKFPVDVDIIEQELGFPVVVKTLRSTRGAGVVLCQDREQFHNFVSLLGDANPSADFIFQKYIRSSHGRDVRLLVIGDRIVATMERRSRDGGFKSNISLGGYGVAIAPPPDMADLALRAARALRLDIAGIDILYDQNGYRICEANSSPGFEGLEKVCRISVPDKVLDFIATRLRPPAPPRVPIWRKLISRVRNEANRKAG